MPPPIKVELVPPSPNWERAAREETARILASWQDCVVFIHHIGSTAISGIRAKPIVDLLPVVRDVNELDKLESVFLNLGYQYWGEYGVPGRRYCTFDEATTQRRMFQLHCFAAESGEVERHLAFRDYLRANPAKAREYDEEKHRCWKMHPDNSHAYTAAKAEWIAAHLIEAITQFRST